MPREQGRKVVASNRKARHDYTIFDTYEAGRADRRRGLLRDGQGPTLPEGRQSSGGNAGYLITACL